MPKHTWATSVKTDNGGGPVDSIDLFGSAEQNIGGNALGLKGLEVGITDVEEVDLAVTVANIVSFFIKSTIWRDFEVELADVMLVGPQQVPKTSSGKKQRAATRALWRDARSSSPLQA